MNNAVLLRFEASAGRFAEAFVTPFTLVGSSEHWATNFRAFWMSRAKRLFPELGRLAECRVVDRVPTNEVRLAPTEQITEWTVREIHEALTRKFPFLRERAEAMAN